MPLPETIKASLSRAAAQGDAGLLLDAYTGVVHSLNANSSADRASLELLVLCAETALKVTEFEIAAECLETYFLEATRYGGAQERVGHVDQFLCRAYYARACVESERTRVLKGEDLVTGTLDSIKFLMKGLELVKSAPRYAFLVYNGTVHYWQVSRPLQRDGKRASLLASQEPFVQALVATVTGQEEWKARCLGALGMCYLESGKPDDAIKALDQAIGLAAGFHDLLLELKAAKTHVGQVSGKGKADTNGVTPDAARALLQTVASQPALPAAQAEPQLQEAWKKVDPNPEQSAKGVDLHVVADIAWVAAKAGCLDLARKCAMRANASQDLLPRVWSDLTISAVRLAQLGESRYKLTSRTVAEHCSVLDALDQTLSQFKRLGVPGGVQDTCRLIWNAGLLLLQPNLRKHVKKTFAAAAKALEEIDSPLNRLRAALHLEVAKADYLDESFPKAAKEVKKGLALDYIAPDEEIKKFRLQRPLDRYLDPMYEALDLKTSITRLPETDLERVVLALERAKDVRNPDVKASQLKQLIAMILDLPPAIPPEAGDEAEDRAQRQHSARLRTTTLCEIVKAAWSVRLSDIVALASPHALAATWDPAVDKEMVVMQAEVAFIEADALVYALLKLEDEPTPPSSWVPSNERPVEEGVEAPQRTPAMEPDAMQDRLPQAILDGMELGLKSAEPWLVLNGAVYAWNHYIHFLNGQHVVVVEPVFKAVTDTLFRMDKESVDPVFVCAMAGAYAEAVEHRIMLGVMGVEWPPPEEEEDIEMEDDEEEEDEEDDKKPVYCPLGAARMAAGKILGENGKLDAGAIEELKPAIGILEGAIDRAGERPSQSMLETYARILKLCGREPVLPPSVKGPQEAAGKVIATIESLSTQTGLEITQLEAQVQTAIEQLRSMGKMATPEFWAKLAQVALQVKATGHALTCAKEVFKCVFGETIQGEDIQDKEDAQDVPDRTWYWLALSEIVHGHAVVGLVKPGAQPRSVQGRLRLIAISHFVTAARFAEFINRKDIVESAARALWNSVGDYLLSPVTRRLLAAPLQGLLNVLNKVGCSDPDFQVALNCLLLESYEDAQDWAKGVKQANSAFKSLKNTLHLPLWEYKTTAVARSGVNVPEEMGVAKQYTDPVHARSWQLLAQQLDGHYDQLAARKQSMDIVKKMPWVRYEYLLEYAEWLAMETGEPDAAEDTLWVAIDILTEVEVEGDEEEEDEEDGGRSGRSGSRVGSKAGSRAPTRASRAGSKAGSRAGSSRSKGSKASKRSSAIRSAVGASSFGKTVVSQTELATFVDLKQPAALNVRHLEALFRAFTMLANLAQDHADRKEYALTAHYYAMRMVSATFQGAVNAPAIKGERGPDGKRLPAPETPPVPPMPEQLQDWADWVMDDATKAALDRVRSRDKLEIISRRSIPCSELTMRYLEFLADLLSGLGLHLHTLPIFQLHGLVATLSARNPTLASISQLLLGSALEDLGALEAASAAIKRAGDLSITADELTNAQYHIDQMNCVKAVIAESSATVGRWRTNSGRFSFLKDTAGDDARDDRPMSAERKAAQTTIHELENGELRSDPFNDNVPEAGVETDSLKESAKLEPEFVSAVSQKMVKGAKADAKSWLVMAPFQPLTPAETWIRKAQWLLKHGQYGPAKEMVDKAYEWSVARDELENKARCHMLYAEMYFLAREHESALVQVQAAQQIGGNVAFWHRSVLTYCQYRRELNGHTADCKAALEACIGLLQQLSKENAASFVDTTTTISSLNSTLAQLLLEEIAENIRTGQAFKHLYERAVNITKDSMKAMAGIGGVGYVFAIMAHADVLLRNPVKEIDRRPALLQVLDVLKVAEQVARQLLDSSRQPDMDVNLNLPCSRILSTVLAKMAEVSLAVAQEREAHEPEDRNTQRPEFPRMSNTGSESSYNPVAAFLDQTASKDDGGFVHPEQDAVVFATTAAMLTSRKTEKAQALAQLGEALSFQFWCSMPGGFLHFNPWTELLEKPVLLEDYVFPEAEGNTEAAAVPQDAPATDEAQPPAESAATAPEPEGEKPPVDEEATQEVAEGEAAADGEAAAKEEAGEPTDLAATADAADPASEAAPAEETPVKEAEPVGFKLWREPRTVPELSEQLREQAVSALQKSIKAAADERLWSVAERAALDLANCNGDTINQAAAANAVILAQSFSAAAFLESQYLQACQPSDMDAILLRQQQILQATSPVWPDSGPGSQSLANFSKSGNASAVLSVDAEVPKILESIPATCRVVSFQLSPEKDYLYAACLNGPQNEGGASNDGADKPPAATKDKKGAPTGAAGPPVSSRASSALRMQLDSEKLSSVIQAVKDFRRSTKQEIESMREPFSGVAEEGKRNRSASRKTKGTAAGKRGSSKDASRTGAKSPEPQAPAAPKVVLYDPAINYRWAAVLEQMEDLFAPLLPMLREFLPEADGAQKSAPKAAAGGAGGLQAIILLDHRLAVLPLEALKIFRQCGAVSRDFSLHICFNRIGSTNPDGTPADPPLVNLNQFAYFVDVRGEDRDKDATGKGQVGRKQEGITEDFNKLIKPRFGQAWSGWASDGSKIASEAEMAELMQGGSGLVYYGLGRMLSYIPPPIIAGVKLNKCNLAIVMDKANNIPAAERQKYLDNHKMDKERALESSPAAAALLSLRGVRNIVINTAFSVVDTNHDVLVGVLDGLRSGQQLGAAHRATLNGLETELDYLKYNAVLYGVPFIQAQTGGK